VVIGLESLSTTQNYIDSSKTFRKFLDLLLMFKTISATYGKCFKENLTLTKNCVLRKSLAYFPMSSRNSYYFDVIRSGVSTKGQVISIGNFIDPTNFKEIGTKKY
jgi:hypothetical protein